MYIIDDTYFQAPKREVANLEEADSKAFAQLELLIDEKCRLLLLSFLSTEQAQELDGYLVDGMFPIDPLDPVIVPQKWIDLVNGKTYEKNGVDLIWTGLIWTKGNYKGSLLADYVYYYWLTGNVSYMTGVGDAKGNPKGANLVNPTQRVVNTWNDFVKAYQSNRTGVLHCDNWFPNYDCYYSSIHSQEVSLMQFLSDHDEVYPNPNRQFFEVKNQLGL